MQALAAWALSALVAPARAQAYPSRTIRLVAPVGAGSGLDARAREVAQKLSDLLGQQVVVENRPGAGGIIAIQQVAKAPARWLHAGRVGHRTRGVLTPCCIASCLTRLMSWHR